MTSAFTLYQKYFIVVKKSCIMAGLSGSVPQRRLEWSTKASGRIHAILLPPSELCLSAPRFWSDPWEIFSSPSRHPGRVSPRSSETWRTRGDWKTPSGRATQQCSAFCLARPSRSTSAISCGTDSPHPVRYNRRSRPRSSRSFFPSERNCPRQASSEKSYPGPTSFSTYLRLLSPLCIRTTSNLSILTLGIREAIHLLP